jgi:hypothetical protein
MNEFIEGFYMVWGFVPLKALGLFVGVLSAMACGILLVFGLFYFVLFVLAWFRG